MLKPGILGTIAFLLVCSVLRVTHGAKILALLSLPSPSHYIFNRALLLALAERGHEVTVISADGEKHPVPNLNSILLEGIYNSTRENFDYEAFINMPIWDMNAVLLDWGVFLCEKELQTEGARKLLNYPSTERFDLIITEDAWGECFFAFIHKFGSPPVVATAGVGLSPWLSSSTSNPENPAYMQNFLVPHTSHMNFGERFLNFVIYNFVAFLYDYRHLPMQEAVARKYFKEDFPSFREIKRNFSIVLVNTVFGLDDPRPLLPNVIPIGGMQIKAKPDPLPKDLQKFLDDAKDGFIFFSLGTNLRSDALTSEKRQALLDAFSELPQRVLWKFETEDLPGLPKNVKIKKWLPQSDILAHPNIRIFITHCGQMSTMEATYRGVPVVGIPFFLDQRVNLKKFITKGVGVQLDYFSITKANVLAALRKILNNDSYRDNMKKMSAIFRDQPETGLERAVYWTEYVIRHNGAPHLRSAAMDLYWHQYLLLDVLLVLTAGALLVFVIVLLVLRKLCKALIKITRGSDKKAKQN